MASSVPALLTKIARFRPRVACFIGKGIWQHVERALSHHHHHLPKSDPGDQNAGITLGAHTSVQGNVLLLLLSEPEPAKTPVTVPRKDEISVYFPLGGSGDTPVVERPLKAEPKGALDFCESVKLEESEQKVITQRRGGISSLRKDKAPRAPAFAYGLQPFKAVHDMALSVRNHFHGLRVNLLFDNLVGLVCKRHRNAFLCLPEHIWSCSEPPGTCGVVRVPCLNADVG